MTSDGFDSVLEAPFKRLRQAELRAALGRLDDLERALDELDAELDEIAARHEAEPAKCR